MKMNFIQISFHVRSFVSASRFVFFSQNYFSDFWNILDCILVLGSFVHIGHDLIVSI